MKDQPTLPPFDLDLEDDVQQMSVIARELKDTEDPDHREGLLVQLAEYGLRTHDFSDTTVCDGHHVVFEKFYMIQQEYRMAALQLGRLVLKTVPEHEEPDGSPELN